MKFERNSLDKLLASQGVSLVPRPVGTKAVSAGFRWTERTDGKTIATLEEIRSWSDIDRAAICGVNGLRVIDFDSINDFSLFWDSRLSKVIFNETLTVKTSRGYQVWFFDRTDCSKYRGKIDARPAFDIELLIDSCLASCPGNTHSSAAKYEIVGTGHILRKDGIVASVIERLRSMGWTGSIYRNTETSASLLNREFSKGLSAEEIEAIAGKIARYWKPGYRNKIVLSLCGILIKRGVSESSALEVFSKIIQLTGDNSARLSVLSKAKYQYRCRARLPNLLGTSGLVEVMR